MSTTPEILVAPLRVNTTPTASVPKVVQPSDGRILVAFMTEVGGAPGTGDGFHIRGQLFDTDGNKIADQPLFDFPAETDTKNLDMVALSGGRVAILADADFRREQDRPTVRVFRISTSGTVSVQSTNLLGGFWTRSFDYDLAKNGSDGWMAHSTTSVPTGVLFSLTTSDRLRQHNKTDHDSEVEVKLVRWLGSRAAGDDNLESTTLENGDIVLLHDTDRDEDASGGLEARIIGTDSNEKRLVKINPAGPITYDANIEALKGGGFVVAYTEDSNVDKDVVLQLFNAQGDVLAANVNVASTGPVGDNNNEPAIAALDDGGFIVFYDKDVVPLQIRGQRFDSTATPVGDTFLLADENGVQIDTTSLRDGKVAVCYTLVGDEGIIKLAILDAAPLVQPEVIRGTDGDDVLTGTRDSDRILGLGGNDDIRGNDGDDTIEGGAGNDVMRGNDGDDIIKGGAGNDVLRGNDGDDTLDGGAGNDELRGGLGTDVFTGGTGSDRFVFNNNQGDNTITDFTINEDLIDLSGVSAIANFSDLVENHLTQAGANAVIDDGAGLRITLTGVDIANLNAASFRF